MPPLFAPRAGEESPHLLCPRHVPSVRPQAAGRLVPAHCPRAAPARRPTPAASDAVDLPPVAAHLRVLTWAADGQATHSASASSTTATRRRWSARSGRTTLSFALSAVSTPASRPLTPGDYRWVVYPVYGGDGSLGSGVTADTQLAQGTFTL